MFINYQNLVLRSYEKKRTNSKLSLRLMHPTPAQLKEECEAVFSERYKLKDSAILKLYFGDGTAGEAGLKAIKRCDVDKFRPLLNFILRKTQAPDPKHVELLAWLIDFELRPFELGNRYDEKELAVDNRAEAVTDSYEENISVETISSAPEEKEKLIDVNQTDLIKNNFKFNWKYTVLVGGFILAAAGLFYYYSNWKIEDAKRKQGCMYWAKDHYQEVSCDEKHGDALIVALDTFKLKYLKKINQTDTITNNAIGSVWYIKTNGVIECFTSSGYYPLDPKRKLKPITTYIIQTYIQTTR